MDNSYSVSRPADKAKDYKIKSENWKAAIGLQAVDGLTPSEYLIDLANRNIQGDLSLDQVRDLLQEYYSEKAVVTDDENRQQEADVVSLRITDLLEDPDFSLSLEQLLEIHRYLLSDIYQFAGQIREYNISKKEWVLNSASVAYGPARKLRDMAEYDITTEQRFDYAGISKWDQIDHIMRFISNLWQAHLFGEGNTRTIAVFLIKYLRTFGFAGSNDLFEQNSWYFRNALVLANYRDPAKKIDANFQPLTHFFENLLFNARHPLRNRDLLIG